MAEDKEPKNTEKKDTKEKEKEVKPNTGITPPVYTTLAESQNDKDEGISKLLIEILKNK